jgi:Domain of unknown function (DUF6458)
MSIGGSIFLIAVGAILKYAVTAQVVGVDIQTVGLILMIAGIVALAISLAMVIAANRNRNAGPGGPTAPPPPPTRYR